jgi:hypothetical protein
MPSIAMLRAKDLLNMAVLRRVVGAVSRALIFPEADIPETALA